MYALDIDVRALQANTALAILFNVFISAWFKQRGTVRSTASGKIFTKFLGTPCAGWEAFFYF